MKKLSTALVALMTFGAVSAQTAQEDPIITFKTNIYDTYGATNSFHIRMGATETAWFDVDCGYGPIECEVTPASFDSETQEISATSIACQVGPDGLVKIYGDASIVDYFDAEGCYIDWIDFGDCTNLDILDLQHNELKRLDLSKYNKLSAIYLSDNPFTEETPLVIGTDHPNLTILEVDIVTYISPDFDITTYPNLMSFDAYANATLTHLDPSKCPKLMRLSLDSCPIKSIDVSQNPLLSVLNVEDSGISELDLSNNPLLTQLYITHMSGSLNQGAKFKSIDLSANPELRYLAASGNNLSDIDISKNPKLDFILLSYNNLTSLDVSANPLISTLDVRYNNMDFATLPLPNAGWYDYEYEQKPMALDRSYPVGAVLDLSDRVLRDNTTTDAVLYACDLVAGTQTPLDESYFEYADGKVTLLKACSDSLYLSFGNTAFPATTLTTDKFLVKTADQFGKPSRIVSFTTSLSEGAPVVMSLGMSGATAANPKNLFVDFGDGNLVEYTITADAVGAAPNVTGTKQGYGSVNIYVPEGEILTAFATDNITMYSLDVAAATELRQLIVRGAGLYYTDLSYNRCLQKLDLSGNNYSTFTLEGINGNYGKNVLSDINLSANKLYEIVLNDTRTITHLDLSDNELAEFDYKEFDNMIDFDISGNKLQTINLAYYTIAKRVDLSNNLLTEVQMPETYELENFDLSRNMFTIATLPLCPGVESYLYTPQADIVLPTKGPGADLSAQNRVIDGVGTTFTWKSADGTALPEGDVQDEGGKARFVNTSVGEIYCEMTNPAFPLFGGDTPFRTTLIEAAGMPSNIVAQFTTTTTGQTAALSLAAAKEGTAVYVDWAGDGYDLQQYQLGTTYRRFDATTIKDADVKVYTYSTDDVLTVFSIGGVSMSSIDASKLTDLICFTLDGSGLSDSDIIYPESAALEELNLNNAQLESLPLAKYPKLRTLSASSNNLSSLNLTGCPNLQLLGIGNNQLADVTLDNPSLWFVDLSGNALESIDLSKLPDLEQLALNNNSLTELDITANKRIRQMLLDHNKFTFATLPVPASTYYQYVYSDQAAVEVQCEDGKVDLSAQASVDGTPTTYQWFIGETSFDDYGDLVGEGLVAGEDFTVEDGVTTFLGSFKDVVCVMTNSVFPSLYLYTEPIGRTQGVTDVAADDASVNIKVIGRDIYVAVNGVDDGTPVGLVALDGRTISSTTVENGAAVIRSAAPGVAVIAVGNRAAKIVVK